MRLIKSLAVLLLSATAMFGQSAVNPGGSLFLPGPGGNGGPSTPPTDSTLASGTSAALKGSTSPQVFAAPLMAPNVNGVYSVGSYSNSCTVAGTSYTTQLDCAFYTLANLGWSGVLHLGSNSFSTPYTTCAGLVEPATGGQISLVGEMTADNVVPGTDIKAVCPIQAIISHPDLANGTSLPYSLRIEGINLDANNQAQQCMAVYAEKVSVTKHVHCRNALSSTKAWVELGDQAPVNGTQGFGYQNFYEDIFVAGNGNAQSSWATVTPTQVSGVPSIAVNTPGSYLNAVPPVYLYGFGAGALPCTTMPTLTPVMAGTGPYTLSSITVTGGVGCAGTLYAYVPDLVPAPYGISISTTDSTMKDMSVANVGTVASINYTNGANVMIHDHPYSGSPILVKDVAANSHYGSELDSATHYGVESDNRFASWYGTMFTWPGGTPNPGASGFYTTNQITAFGTNCGGATTNTNGFNLLVYSSSGPVAHGNTTSYGGSTISGATQCDNLSGVNAFPNAEVSGQFSMGSGIVNQDNAAADVFGVGTGANISNSFSISARARVGFLATPGTLYMQGKSGVDILTGLTVGTGKIAGWGLSGIVEEAIGTAIPSATTIAPSAGITHITGTTTVSTITAPTGCTTAGMGCIETFIPDGAVPFVTGGNIANAVTAAVNVPIIAVYDPTQAKWNLTSSSGSGSASTNATTIQGVAVAGVAGAANQNVATTALAAFAAAGAVCGQADGSIGQAGCSSTTNSATQVGYDFVRDGGGKNDDSTDNGALLNTLLSFSSPCNATFTTSCVPAVIHFKAGIYKITTMVHPTMHSNTGDTVFDCEGGASPYGGGRTVFDIVVPAGQDGFWFDGPAGSNQFHGPEFRGCNFSDGNEYTYTNAGNIPFGTLSPTAASDIRAGLHYSGINDIKGMNIGFSYFLGDHFNPNGSNGGAVVTSGQPCKITAGQFVIVCSSTTATAAQAAQMGQGFFWVTDTGGTGRGYPQEISEAHLSTGNTWSASKVFYQGDVITDGTNTQMVTTVGTGAAWIASHVYSVGDPILDSNGNMQIVTVAGTSSTVHPTWSTSLNGTVTDGGVTWKNVEVGNAGGVSGTSAPTWATTVNGTVTENNVTWTTIASGTSTLVLGMANVYQHVTQAAAFNWYINYNGHGLLIDGFGNARTANGHNGTYTSFSQYGAMYNIFSYCTLFPVSLDGTFYQTFTSGGTITGTFTGASQGASMYGVSRDMLNGGWVAGSCPGNNSAQAPNGRVANSIAQYEGVDTDTIAIHIAANFFTASNFMEVTHASDIGGEFENTGSGVQPDNFVCTDTLGSGYTTGHCAWGVLEEGDQNSGTHSAYNKIRPYVISMGNGIEIGANNLRTVIEAQLYGSTAAQSLNYAAGNDTVNGHDIVLPSVGDPNCSVFSVTSCLGLSSTQINGTSGINKWPMVTPLTAGATCNFIGGEVEGSDGKFYGCSSAGIVVQH